MYNGSNGVSSPLATTTTSGTSSLRAHLQSRHVSTNSSPIPNSNGSNTSRSSAPSPSVSPTRPKFDGQLLKTYMKKLLQSTLGSATWPDLKDKDRVRMWCREIGERVKERAVGRSPLYYFVLSTTILIHTIPEIEPRGFKYMVTTQINENLGQGGRADLVCHWEDSDTVIKERHVIDISTRIL
ncbi:hypothetical protein Clacol_001586 [Clathrus columnatus]|uniref:Uncharacterized protein n=1 Tax=Clathrus columnatus TaxID=1419009 RepID=A0AAV5A273_9AGAM|nr:hypothetical protein Clacol_001586 [Clathrus columnatus]